MGAQRILDIGCGVGTHTFLLAEHFRNATIIGIDNHAAYIDTLNEEAKKQGISDRVQGMKMSMFEMNFEEESFDLIWSEGSIYIMGFQKGLKEFKRFLKPNGYLICSEIGWLVENPSEESADFWNKGYLEMDTVTNKLEKIKMAGYEVKEHFVCPVTDWTTNYYDFVQRNLDAMKVKYEGNEEAIDVIGVLQLEIDIYHRHYDEYSYVFYAMKKM